jgi:protein involved in polysaccharide export with SLBB domain
MRRERCGVSPASFIDKNCPMNPADNSIKILRGYFTMLRLFIMALGCVLLLSGCITSSSEDDYVSGVLAEAMQEYPPEAVLSGSTTDHTIQPLVAAPVQETVPAPVVAPVSLPPSVTVSVPSQESTPAPAASTVSAVPVSAVSVSVVKPEEPSRATPAPILPPVVAPAPVNTATVEAPVSSSTAAPEPAVVPVVVPVAEVRRPVSPPVNYSAGKQMMPPPAVPTIQPDSVLWVSVSEDPSLNGRYMVNDSSAIDFGYVGLVFLQDMEVEKAEMELKRVLEGRYLKNATVSVKLAKASYDKIGVQGTVELPSDIKIGPGATISLSEALRRAGGLRGNRENSRVKIVRGGLKTPFGPAAEGEVYSLVTKDGQLKVPDIFLRNDDLAYVFTPSTDAPQGSAAGATGSTGAGGKRVVLLGEVPRRGVVEFSENEPCTLMYLLFKVGGLPRFAKANKITVVRRNKDGSEQKFLVDGEKLMNNGKPEDDLVLETGDRIVVPARKISFF